MRSIFFSDQTLFSPAARSAGFRQKLEAARILDHVGMDAVEIPCPAQDEGDQLLLRSLCSTITHSTLACETGWTAQGIQRAWAGIEHAERPRLIVTLPMTASQLEYACHMKPAQALEAIPALVSQARSLCEDVEFSCEDVTRAELPFVQAAIRAAVEAGAGRITLCDTAGVCLPDEIAQWVRFAREAAGDQALLGLLLTDTLGLAAACALQGLSAGADGVKTAYGAPQALSAATMAHLIRARGADLRWESTIDCTRATRTAEEMYSIFTAASKQTPFDGHAFANVQEMLLPAGASETVLFAAIRALGYELSEDDLRHVKEAIDRESKGRALTRAELEALILASSRQVPPTYRLKSYVINSGNTITPSAHIALDREGETLVGLCAGDGPIDAAFLAIEQIIGRHYELDDFQIATVTQNRASMGDALVRLRHDGKIYAGKGISTDIIGAAIRAYLNALNKIAYEEKPV